MTNFLHWRKMTWILLLWSAAAVTWLLVADSGAAVVGLLWLLGMVGLGFVWFAYRPLFRQGRGLRRRLLRQARPRALAAGEPPPRVLKAAVSATGGQPCSHWPTGFRPKRHGPHSTERLAAHERYIADPARAWEGAKTCIPPLLAARLGGQ